MRYSRQITESVVEIESWYMQHQVEGYEPLTHAEAEEKAAALVAQRRNVPNEEVAEGFAAASSKVAGCSAAASSRVAGCFEAASSKLAGSGAPSSKVAADVKPPSMEGPIPPGPVEGNHGQTRRRKFRERMKAWRKATRAVDAAMAKDEGGKAGTKGEGGKAGAKGEGGKAQAKGGEKGRKGKGKGKAKGKGKGKSFGKRA